MMKQLLIMLLTSSVIVGCASQPRSGPPAPVDSSRSSSPARDEAALAQKQAEAQAQPQTVEVYAYRPPASAPDALPTEVETAPQGLQTGSMVSLPMERAAAPPTGGPVSPGGAGASGAPVSEPAPRTAPQVDTFRPPSPPEPTLQPAAAGLAAQAEQQRQMGNYVGAAATLERAMRIQPQQAYLWNRLARVRMEQGSYGQAGNLAKRSNALVKDQPELKQDNWSIISVSRRTSGDLAGAMEAEQKARGG